MLVSFVQIRILEVILQNDMCRKDLVEKLKKPRTTIFDNLNILRKNGYLNSYNKKIDDCRGRPYTYWCITKKGIDFYNELKNKDFINYKSG